MNEWNIQSRAHICEICTQPFADKQPYRTVLFAEGSELRRSDICGACAERVGDTRLRKGFISQWNGTYEAPPAQPVDAIQKDTAETILRKLVELNDPRYAAAGYILAVMLERKRILRVKEQVKRDGKRIFIYEQPKTGDVFAIVDPELHLNQLEQVQHDVAALLEHGLNPPATPTETPAATAEASPTETETAPQPAEEAASAS
ncbi:MAG TPA: hypothetical protein VG347_02225 [Verrucomicrobiae bacterium]|nr:hypothetical protein [Verrucomicrobiae bacterium]